MKLRLFFVGMSIPLLSLLITGCGKEVSSSHRVLGRWQVIENQGISVPNSFFWFSMDYLEFREDGTVLALVKWPPDVGRDIRLNKTASYSLVGENQIEFVGACRHQDPCTGVYTATLKGDKLQLFDTDGILTLMRVGPPGENLPPTIVGPSASPTPVEPTRQPKPPTPTPEAASTPRLTLTQNLPVSKTVEPIVTVMSGDKGQGTWLNCKMDEVFDLVVGDTIWMATSEGVLHFNPVNDEISDNTKNLIVHDLHNAIAVDYVGHRGNSGHEA